MVSRRLAASAVSAAQERCHGLHTNKLPCRLRGFRNQVIRHGAVRRVHVLPDDARRLSRVPLLVLPTLEAHEPGRLNWNGVVSVVKVEAPIFRGIPVDGVPGPVLLVPRLLEDRRHVRRDPDAVEGVLLEARREGQRHREGVRPQVLRGLLPAGAGVHVRGVLAAQAVQQPPRDAPQVLRHGRAARQEVAGAVDAVAAVAHLDERPAPDRLAAHGHDHGQGGAAAPDAPARQGAEEAVHEGREARAHGGKVPVVAREEGVEGLGQAEHRRGDVDLCVDVVVDPVRVDAVGDPLEEVVPDVAAHRVRDDDGLLPVHGDEGLDLLPQPGEVPVPALQVPEGQAPVIGGHVHGVVIIPNVCQGFDHHAPEPVACHEEVRAFETLRGADTDTPIEVRALERVQTCGGV
mmetsp:Transcript_43736/g.126336  ORF Transcript_43736/g.126336 Transcript_43736/m.126336 type:complete len:404 (-) Transcript_43736:732-1943(-)